MGPPIVAGGLTSKVIKIPFIEIKTVDGALVMLNCMITVRSDIKNFTDEGTEKELTEKVFEVIKSEINYLQSYREIPAHLDRISEKIKKISSGTGFKILSADIIDFDWKL